MNQKRLLSKISINLMISIELYLLIYKLLKNWEVNMGIIVQVLGSLLILIGFVFSQLGKLKITFT